MWHPDDIHYLGWYSVVLQDAPQRYPVNTIECFLKVYKTGIDCAVPLPRLLKDLPESKDVVTAGSPFTEASLLFTDVLPQGSSHAPLYDLTEHFACETQECYAPPVVAIR